MAYQASWVSEYKIQPCRSTEAVLFNPLLQGGGKGIYKFPKRISTKVNIIAWKEFELGF